MGYTNSYGKKYLVGDWLDMNGTKYQIMDFKLTGMVLVRTLGKHDEWIYRVMAPDSLGLVRKD